MSKFTDDPIINRKPYIPVMRKRLVMELIYGDGVSLNTPFIKEYLFQLSQKIGMTIVYGPIVHNWAHEYNEFYDGYEGWIMWAESGCQFYSWERFNFITIDLFTCKEFEEEKAVVFTKNYFNAKNLEYVDIPPVLGGPQYRNPNNHPSVRIGVSKTQKNLKGLTLIATKAIPAGEIVCKFDGEVVFAASESQIETIITDRGRDINEEAIPVGKCLYRNGSASSFSNWINHSCNPNCKIVDLYKVVTTRNISKGEELCTDYGTYCNSDWKNPEGVCLCGEENCRGQILPWRELPLEDRKKYYQNNMVSQWIIDEMSDEEKRELSN